MLSENSWEGRKRQTGEVFTPKPLVLDMLRRLPLQTWLDDGTLKDKTFLDNSAGDGNFLVQVKRLLVKLGVPEQHILEEQVFGVEIMPDNVMSLQERLGYLVRVNGNLVPNPLLDLDHYSTDPIAHALPDGSSAPETYLHHRNIICADALEYDYKFGRVE